MLQLKSEDRQNKARITILPYFRVNEFKSVNQLDIVEKKLYIQFQLKLNYLLIIKYFIPTKNYLKKTH